MKNILILNGHQPYPIAKGALNAAFVDRARRFLEANDFSVRVTEVTKGYDIETETNAHRWADALILQFPVNWMGVPWSFKKYMDEVYTAGMDGRLSNGDGRSQAAPEVGYGTGGTMIGRHYMLSVTFNAPRAAFDNQSDWFFAGASVDDLLRPVHLTFKFFGMSPLATFAAFDVIKNPTIADDFTRFDAHLAAAFGGADPEATADPEPDQGPSNVAA